MSSTEKESLKELEILRETVAEACKSMDVDEIAFISEHNAKTSRLWSAGAGAGLWHSVITLIISAVLAYQHSLYMVVTFIVAIISFVMSTRFYHEANIHHIVAQLYLVEACTRRIKLCYAETCAQAEDNTEEEVNDHGDTCQKSESDGLPCRKSESDGLSCRKSESDGLSCQKSESDGLPCQSV